MLALSTLSEIQVASFSRLKEKEHPDPTCRSKAPYQTQQLGGQNNEFKFQAMGYVVTKDNIGFINHSVASTSYSSRMGVGLICHHGGSIGYWGHRTGFAPVYGEQDSCERVGSEGTCEDSTALLNAFVNSDHSHVPILQDSFLDVVIHLRFGVDAVPVGKVLHLVMHSRNLLRRLDSTDALSK